MTPVKPLTLTELVINFQQEYADAPIYKGYSQALKRSIPTKQQIQSEFISNLQMLAITTDDPDVEVKVERILKKYM